jgi:hypothetical protein
MIDKLSLIRAVIGSVITCVLAWDAISGLIRHTTALPHRDLMVAGAVLWIVSLFFPEQRNDDWAGQF